MLNDFFIVLENLFMDGKREICSLLFLFGGRVLANISWKKTTVYFSTKVGKNKILKIDGGRGVQFSDSKESSFLEE